ncbi:MAG: hypothetical protein HYZ75_07800 [Elusimicrobia bacterium]|nr:hypothetical protein [Elusimicrobiota bacterium]
MIAAWLVFLALTPAFAAEEYAQAYEGLPLVVLEMNLKPPATHLWSITEKAFGLTRKAQAGVREPADGPVVERLGNAYDEVLSLSLRDLRHVVFFDRRLMSFIDLGSASIDVNARHGRASILRDPKLPGDVNAPPQPVDFSASEAFREDSRAHAEKARRSMAKGLLDLRSLKTAGLSPQGLDAYRAMIAAFEAALETARKLEEFNLPQGAVQDAVDDLRRYYEAANKALKPQSEHRDKAKKAYFRAAWILANIEAEIAGVPHQAIFLHVEIDKLGPLKRP